MEFNSEENSMEQTAEGFFSFEFLLIFLMALLPPTLTFSGYFRRREETSGSRSLSPAKSLRQQREASTPQRLQERNAILAGAGKARAAGDVLSQMGPLSAMP